MAVLVLRCEALSVKTLRLKHCRLGDFGCASILSLLEEWCPYLEVLDIGANQVSASPHASDDTILGTSLLFPYFSISANSFGIGIVT
eukprot:COSAG05_NODE_825_length_7106_cov_74.690881_14_plen_87_part_00